MAMLLSFRSSTFLVVFLIAVVVATTSTTLAYPDRADSTTTTTSSLSTPKCPFGKQQQQQHQQQQASRRRMEEADSASAAAEAYYKAMQAEKATRLEEWIPIEDSYPLVERLYSPGEPNEGEEYCSGSEDYKYCNKIHGPWGDSIPQNETYCLWAMLEFQDPNEFGYGQDNSNSSAFDGIFGATIESVAPLLGQGRVLMVGATGGVAGGDPTAVPWPTASIIWSDGNKHAKEWIADIHRPQQEAGYSFGYVSYLHMKAVECSEIMPMFEKHGLINVTADGEYNYPDENFDAPGFLKSEPGSQAFRIYWNAFSEMTDHSPKFYQPDEPCTLGPCPTVTSDGDADADGDVDADADTDADAGDDVDADADVNATATTADDGDEDDHDDHDHDHDHEHDHEGEDETHSDDKDEEEGASTESSSDDKLAEEDSAAAAATSTYQLVSLLVAAIALVVLP